MQAPPAHAANQQAALLNNDGVKALNSGNFQLAIQKFEEALKIEPGYSFARDNLAIAYNNYALKLHDPVQSMKMFHKALAISPGNTTTAQNLDSVIASTGKNPHSFKDRVEIGKQCRAQGDFDGAIVEYQAALRLQNDAKLHAELGDVLRVRDRVDDAIKEYKDALAAGGLDQATMASINVRLGQAYQAKKDLPDAIKSYGNAIKYKSDDPDVLDALVTGWKEALNENPQAPENHIGLGQALQYKGDFGQAEAEYKMALMLDRNNMVAKQLLAGLGEAKRKAEIAKHINAGVDYQTNKQYDQAIGEYMAALKMSDPSHPDPDIFVNIGSACQAKEDYDHAIAAYQRALSLQPANKAAQQGIKACTDARESKQLDDLTKTAGDLYKAGKYADALQAYQQILKKTPNDAGIHFNIAACEQELKRIDDAIAEYRMAVTLDPKNADYKSYLEKALDTKAQPIIDQAVAAHKAKQYAQAVDLYQQAINIRPKNVELYYDIASALYSLQRYDQARGNYQKALELDPKGQISDWWLLGTIDENYGKGYDAIDKYRKYLAAAPTGQFAKAAQERLNALLKNPNDCQKIKSEDELARIQQATDAAKQAIQLQQSKQFDQAIPLYQKAMQLQPQEGGYPFGIAACYFGKGDLENASQWIDKAIALDPKNSDYQKYKQAINDQRAEKMVNDAVAKQNAEDYKDAITLYQQALQLAPKNARLWTNLGSAFYNSDDFNDAYNAYKKGFDLDNKGEKLNLYSLAAIDENFGRGTQALDEYRRFVAMNPGDKLIANANDRIKVLVSNPRSTQTLPTHAQLKSFEAAQKAFDDGVKAQEAKQYDQAIEAYQKAMLLNPKEASYPFAVGSVFQAKNDLANAAQYYEKALALAPKNADYKKYLDSVRNGEAAPLVDDAAKKYTAGDFAGAIDEYRKALQIIPNDASVHTDLASALQANDDFTGALQEYETAYKLDPKGQSEVQYFIGALKENFNRGTDALANYREYLAKNPNGKFKQYALDRSSVLAKNPNNVEHLLTRAQRANATALQDEFDEAVKLQGASKYADADAKYADLMQKNPQEAAYPYARGTNYQAQGDIQNAIAMYDKAIALDPKNADYKKAKAVVQDAWAGQLVQKANEKFGAKDYAAAADLFKQAAAAATAKTQPNIWTNVGIALQYQDQWQAARDAYNKGFTMDPKGEVDDLYFMGQLDETLGKGQAAFEDYKKYLQYAPNGKYKSQANDRYQVLYFDKTKLVKLQSQAQIAAAQQSSQAYNDAVQLQQQNKLDEAIAKYQEALKDSPNADSFWYSLGTAYQAKGDMDKAMEAYQKAVQLNPKEPSYKKVLNDLKAAKAAPLADSAIKKQTATPPDLPGAIADYEASLKIYDDPGTHLNLGTAYQANNQLPKAEYEYLRALQLDPKQNDAHYYLGTLYEQMKKPVPAKLEYRKYLSGAPAGQYSADVKSRLKLLK